MADGASALAAAERQDRLEAWGGVALTVLSLAALWQGLHYLAGDSAIASLPATLRETWHLLSGPRYWPHFRETMSAFLWALLIAVTGGVGIGVALGGHRLSGEVAEPVLVALYSIPKVTLYPVVLLFFGIGLNAKIAFGALHGVIPVAIFAMNAVRNVNPTWLRTAATMNLGPLQTARHILVPATIPEIFSGLRIGLSLTLLGVMIGELFASQRGIGHLLMTSIEVHDVRRIMAVVLIVSVLAVTLNALMLAIDRRLHRRV
ncbi:MAG: ABC transporter permease subunit [Alphaproteobacteria bacterium]|nr:ABC transporter permease subunit [Alphaproteobacteria bacterium]